MAPVGARAMDIDEISLKAALDELERLIATRVVVGERITVNDHVIIPLCSCGFGLGAGRGGGDQSARSRKANDRSDRHKGWGSGLGLGGGVRPVGVIIAGPDGVRVEPIALDDGLSLDTLRALVGELRENDAS